MYMKEITDTKRKEGIAVELTQVYLKEKNYFLDLRPMAKSEKMLVLNIGETAEGNEFNDLHRASVKDKFFTKINKPQNGLGYFEFLNKSCYAERSGDLIYVIVHYQDLFQEYNEITKDDMDNIIAKATKLKENPAEFLREMLDNILAGCDWDSCQKKRGSCGGCEE
jgi:hypothetical protein